MKFSFFLSWLFYLRQTIVLLLSFLFVACSSYNAISYKGQLNDPIMVIALLSEQQYEWAGTPYLIGGNSRDGIDCSGFVQKTFSDRFDINLPRTTILQSKQGVSIPLKAIQTGDLVFFKTGSGPNGYHVGIYVKDDLFLHASTKGGVIYSSLKNSYWETHYWQTRRI